MSRSELNRLLPVGLLTLAVEPAKAKSGAAGSASFISVLQAPRNNPTGAGFQIDMEPLRCAEATAARISGTSRARPSDSFSEGLPDEAV